MKTIAGLLIFVGLSVACTSAGTERKTSVPADVSESNEFNTVAAEFGDSTNNNIHHSSDTLLLAFVGDIMPGTTYPEKKLPENDGRDLFRDVSHLLANADVAAGNMEGVLADTGTTTKKKGGMNYAFRIPVRYGKLLSDAGLDFMSMANNHSFDFGLAGVKSTEATLARNGIAYAGISGRTESAIVERNGVKYGFCAFGHNSYTMKHADTAKVAETIRNLRTRADIVVVSFHGGAEGTAHRHLPQGKELFLGEDRGELRNFAHFCIDNGADIVYGHGPHVVRAMELYKGHFIAYSLGNFCTPSGINISGISGYAPVLQLWINATDGKFMRGKINSFKQKWRCGPRLDSTNAAAKEIRSLTLSDISGSKIQINDNGEILRR